MRDEDEARIGWAQNKIADLQAQRQGIDDAIRRHEDFIAMLRASSVAIRGTALPRRDDAILSPPLKTLRVLLESALSQAGPNGLTVKQVTKRAIELGYDASARKTPVRVMVSTELIRLSDPKRTQNPSIVKIGPGRYVLKRLHD